MWLCVCVCVCPAEQEAGAAGGGRRRKGGRAAAAAAAAAAGGLAGRYAVSRGVTGLPDPMAGLRVGERRTRARNLLGEEELVPLLPTPQVGRGRKGGRAAWQRGASGRRGGG